VTGLYALPNPCHVLAFIERLDMETMRTKS